MFKYWAAIHIGALLAASWTASVRPSDASVAQILLRLVPVASSGPYSKALAYLPPTSCDCVEDHWAIFRAHVYLTTYPTKFDFLLLMYLLSELEAGVRTLH